MKTVKILLVVALLLLFLVLFIAFSYVGGQTLEAFTMPPQLVWTREFPKPLGNLPEGRIPSCRNTERYECGLLCGYSYDGKKDVSAVVCVPYWFKSTFEMPPPPPTPPSMP